MTPPEQWNGGSRRNCRFISPQITCIDNLREKLTSAPRQSEHVRRIAHFETLPLQCGVYKKRCGRAEGAVRAVDVPEDMQQRLRPTYCVEQLVAAFV